MASTGQSAGSEVVQLYVHDKVSSVTRPVKELKAFRRITVKTGERQTVTFDFAPQTLGCGHRDEAVVEPGDLDIMVGPIRSI